MDGISTIVSGIYALYFLEPVLLFHDYGKNFLK